MQWTYQTLNQALQDWPLSASTNYLSNLQNIISLGELRLWGDLNIEGYDKVDEVNIQTTIGNRTTLKPTDVKQVRNVGYFTNPGDKYVPIEKRTQDYCKMWAPDATVQDKPMFYAELTVASILIVPTPDKAYQVAYHYIAGAPTETLLVTAPNSTTWLSRIAPDALLAACLAESEHFIQADDRYTDYINKYNNELLPRLRAELRGQIRADYSPIKSAAMPAQG